MGLLPFQDFKRNRMPRLLRAIQAVLKEKQKLYACEYNEMVKRLSKTLGKSETDIASELALLCKHEHGIRIINHITCRTLNIEQWRKAQMELALPRGAFYGSLFMYGMTFIGALTPLLTGKNVNPVALNVMLGFSGGVMIAASFWSLLSPAIEIAESQGISGVIPAVTGFLLGGLFMQAMDLMIPLVHGLFHLNTGRVHQGTEKVLEDVNEHTSAHASDRLSTGNAEEMIDIPELMVSTSSDGPDNTEYLRSVQSERPPLADAEAHRVDVPHRELSVSPAPSDMDGDNLANVEPSVTSNDGLTAKGSTEEVPPVRGLRRQSTMEFRWRRALLLVMAITMHNIPEGLAVGVAFGAVGQTPTATLGAAILLAFGIGVQNLPEGVAVALPLRREGLSRLRSLWYGQLSGLVEIFSALLGAWATSIIHVILPYALSFAAGAMIFVVVDELVPESQRGSHPRLATVGLMLGFAVMMTLDVALG